MELPYCRTTKNFTAMQEQQTIQVTFTRGRNSLSIVDKNTDKWSASVSTDNLTLKEADKLKDLMQNIDDLLSSNPLFNLDK